MSRSSSFAGSDFSLCWLAFTICFFFRLKKSGLGSIEIGSFVRADWVPQMADTAQLIEHLRTEGVLDLTTEASVLTPNMKGLEAAVAAGVGEVAIFGAASEKFSKKNINCSIDESLARLSVVAKEAINRGFTLETIIVYVVLFS